jgi:drug/metabolite transporter (DMT)-like permease
VKASAWGLFALVSLLWGVPYLFIEIALRDIGPLSIAAARIAIAALVMAPFLLHGQRWRVLAKCWRALLVLAVVEVFVPLSLITVGQLSVPSGTTGVIIATEPLFIAVLAPLLIRKPWLSPSGWVGLVLGLIGVTTLLGLDAAGPGVLLIAGAALAYGLGAVLIDRWFNDYDALTVAAAMILAAAPLLIAIAVATEPIRAPSDTTVFSLITLGVACTAGGFTAFFALIKRAGPTTAALTTYTAPIIAVVAGVLVLGENLTLWQVLSCSMILVGAAFIVRPRGGRSGGRPSRMNPAEQSSVKV